MIRLLIVDDEAIILRFLVRVLAREGYSIQTARNGQEALHLLRQQQFDLLLTDIKMDGPDGVHLLQQAKALDPELAVVLLTGHATVDSAVAALRYGASNYLLKPARNEDILKAVAGALEERDNALRHRQLEQVASQLADLFAAPPDHAVVSGDNIIRCGEFELHTTSFKSFLNGEAIHLTPTEFRLALELCSRPGATIAYIELVQAACGYTCSRFEAQDIIGAHVRNLRQKLGVDEHAPLYVESVRGIGYRIISPEEAVSGR
ncbi:MAG: response regulator transcription factor [Chloroflexi bacterium]|nr:response regulator transcription factor [Chloroflexota bacterium]